MDFFYFFNPKCQEEDEGGGTKISLSLINTWQTCRTKETVYSALETLINLEILLQLFLMFLLFSFFSSLFLFFLFFLFFLPKLHTSQHSGSGSIFNSENLADLMSLVNPLPRLWLRTVGGGGACSCFSLFTTDSVIILVRALFLITRRLCRASSPTPNRLRLFSLTSLPALFFLPY